MRKATARGGINRKPAGPVPKPRDTPEALKALFIADKISMLEFEQRLEKCLG